MPTSQSTKSALLCRYSGSYQTKDESLLGL